LSAKHHICGHIALEQFLSVSLPPASITLPPKPSINAVQIPLKGVGICQKLLKFQYWCLLERFYFPALEVLILNI
jgi:hypothetical protein